MTLNEWVVHHAEMFGLDRDEDVAMVNAWANLFGSQGYTPDDLMAATRHIAATSPPRFRSEHLAALHARLQAQRASQATPGSSSEEIGPPGASCAACGGTGYIADLPNPDSIAKGRWTTCAASCDCAVGQWIRRNQGDRPLQRFSDYQTLLPDWRERIQEREAYRRALSVAAANASHMDRLMGEVLHRLRTMRGDPKPEPPPF